MFWSNELSATIRRFDRSKRGQFRARVKLNGNEFEPGKATAAIYCLTEPGK
jgi:hypothetical protein